jgi:hypothetical protein
VVRSAAAVRAGQQRKTTDRKARSVSSVRRMPRRCVAHRPSPDPANCRCRIATAQAPSRVSGSLPRRPAGPRWRAPGGRCPGPAGRPCGRTARPLPARRTGPAGRGCRCASTRGAGGLAARSTGSGLEGHGGLLRAVGRKGPAAPSAAARGAQSPRHCPPICPPGEGAAGSRLPPGAVPERMKALVSEPTRAFTAGVSDGARTRDTQDHNLVLYQLSYTHHVSRTAARQRVDRGTAPTIPETLRRPTRPGVAAPARRPPRPRTARRRTP